MTAGQSSTSYEPGQFAEALPVERFSIFSRERVTHGVTTRTSDLPLSGNMSFMLGDQPEDVRYNRRAWAKSIGYNADDLILARQVHGTTIRLVDASDAGAGANEFSSAIIGVDGLITRQKGLPIGVMSADCVPVLIHDPVAGAVGAVHAGWRGTVDGIAAIAVAAMSDTFGSNPADLQIAFAPSICPDCYQVGNEVIDRWRNGQPELATEEAVRESPDGIYFDLRTANIMMLTCAGVPMTQIETSPTCTRCVSGAQFSRRGLGPRTGLFASIIMLNSTGDTREVLR